MKIRAGHIIEVEARRRGYTIEEMLAIRAVEQKEDAEDEWGYNFVHTFRDLLSRGIETLLRTNQIQLAEPKGQYLPAVVPPTPAVPSRPTKAVESKRVAVPVKKAPTAKQVPINAYIGALKRSWLSGASLLRKDLLAKRQKERARMACAQILTGEVFYE